VADPLAFIPKIIEAHEEAVKHQRGTLDYAIKAGGLLKQAKAALKANGGDWLPWLTEHLPSIPQTTANLYMRLAANQDKLHEISNALLTAAGDGELSIRKAVSLLPKRSRTKRPAKPTATPKPSATDLTSMLQNVDADEVGAALKANWEPAKQRKLSLIINDTPPPEEIATAADDDDDLDLKTTLANVEALDLLLAIEDWDYDRLKKLCQGLVQRVERIEQAEAA
jgi:hypothetical protein